jgi:hypothetical protein
MKKLDEDLLIVLQQGRLCGKAFGRGDEAEEKRRGALALRAARRIQKKLDAYTRFLKLCGE